MFKECNVEEIEEEVSTSKSSKKSKGEEKAPSLRFMITSKVDYKTVLKGDVMQCFFAHDYCITHLT